MNPADGHWRCGDCGRACTCLFPVADHLECGHKGGSHLVLLQGPQPVPKPKRTRKRRKDRTWQPGLYEYIIARDGGCVAPRLNLGSDRPCWGRSTVDHVRRAPGLSIKSRSTADNLVTLCGQHHFDKTVHRGGDWRPRLIEYLNEKESSNSDPRRT